MRLPDQHHNEDEQVREYLSKALALTRELAVDEDLRPVFFQLATQLYSAKTIYNAETSPVLGFGGRRLPS